MGGQMCKTSVPFDAPLKTTSDMEKTTSDAGKIISDIIQTTSDLFSPTCNTMKAKTLQDFLKTG